MRCFWGSPSNTLAADPVTSKFRYAISGQRSGIGDVWAILLAAREAKTYDTRRYGQFPRSFVFNGVTPGQFIPALTCISGNFHRE